MVKISLLIALLLSLPKTLFIYRMIERGNMDFSEVAPSEFMVQLLFFFAFSYLILQLSANWAYQLFKVRAVRILMNLLLGMLVLVVLLQLLLALYPTVTGAAMSREERGFLTINYATVFLVLFFVARILRLQLVQKQNLLENERLKQQNLENELNALKNQIDPHFLFNSLNSLNSLVRGNEAATNFVSKLSFMYRYILQSSHKDTISVKEELKFLESYVYLIQTRYRDRFSLQLDIDAQHLDRKVPPLALQLLVENAVKHNEISESHPLHVHIRSQDGTLVVENALRPRSTLAEGTGNGLANLGKRYQLLGQGRMRISNSNHTFSVALPLL